MGRKTYIPKPEEIPSGICECGCGQQTAIATRQTKRDRRHFPGYPMPYLMGHSRTTFQKGPQHWNWNGGRTISSKGYVLLLMPDHPDADHDGYVREHRIVWEQYHGPLQADQDVHHINEIKSDNRIENLKVLSHSAHSSEHGPERMKITRQKHPNVASKGARCGAHSRWHEGDFDSCSICH